MFVVFLGMQQMDVIGVYQHAYLMKAGMTDKGALLRKLDSLLSSLPVRSHILLGGDYNAALISESRVCGHGILQKELSDKEKADKSKLMDILKRHGLVALNTWGKKTTASTYIHAKGTSHMMTRHAIADGVAKQTRPQKTRMAGWRTTGQVPLLGSVMLSS